MNSHRGVAPAREERAGGRPFVVSSTRVNHGPVYAGSTPDRSRCPACHGRLLQVFYPAESAFYQLVLHHRTNNRDCRLIGYIQPTGKVALWVLPQEVSDLRAVEFVRKLNLGS